jgi:tight adherence protein C
MAGTATVSAILVFVAVFAGALAAYRLGHTSKEAYGDRLLEPGSHSANATSLLRGRTATGGVVAPFIEWLTHRARASNSNRPRQRRVAAALAHAGYLGMDKLAIFGLIQVVVGGVFALLGTWVAWGNGSTGIDVGIVFGIVGYILPLTVLRRMGRKRLIRIARELPAILDLMIVCLEAGLGLAEAVRLVGREAERYGQVLGTEFGVAAAEMSTGVALGDSLRNLADRSGSDELKNLAALIVQSDQMGTRLGPALRASGEQFAAKRRSRAEEKAQRSAVHMLFPLVTLILPAMLIVILGPAVIQVMAVFR